jgi:hypothetical protein
MSICLRTARIHRWARRGGPLAARARQAALPVVARVGLQRNDPSNTYRGDFRRGLSEAGWRKPELTQGLCSPCQNDFRECSCYYWASSRPDYVNVTTGEDWASRGDHWMQKERTGGYIPDDYQTRELIVYDDLFRETILKFEVDGKDYGIDVKLGERPAAAS